MGGLADRVAAFWANRAPVDRRSLGLSLLCIAAVQALYWFVVQPSLFAKAPPVETLEVLDPHWAALPAPTRSAIAAARFEPVELPYDGCCAPGYGVLRTEFELTAIPEAGLELATPRGADNAHILLNGAWIHQPGRIALPDITYHGTLRSVIRIPASALKIGRNRLEAVMVRSATPYMDAWPPQLAPAPTLSQGTARSLFLGNEYRVLSSSIAAIVALLALMLLLRSEQRALPFWGFVLAAAWGLRTHYYLWSDPPFSGPGRLAYYFTVTGLVPVAWANLANEWTGRPIRAVRWLATLGGLAMIAVMVWALLAGWDGAYDLASQITDLGGVALGVIACAVLIWHLVTRRDDRHWEVAILILVITLLTSDYLKQYTQEKSNVFMANTVPLLLIGFAVAFLARNVRLFRSVSAINQLLAGQLKEREAELAVQYARQEELARRETLVGERQRLMRDMHDGIGGQLMSLLFAARQKVLPPEELAQSLQAVIDELRLIIDSLDTVGESLSAALASFRGRIEPRLSAAGITIHWSNTLPDALPELPPRTILQVFRIVQEAITNAIKHSGTRSLAVSVALADAPGRPLEIRIADQGQGFDPVTALGGRGLESMEARAAAIGGTLTVTPSAEGTAVILTVPIPAEGAA
ncbi:MAG TPA: sensor histidine kinase [Novosphingobium sp.]|nr:sensor histidine kinase [Novosphingobium sp.]